MPKRLNWFLRKTPEFNWMLCILWANVAVNLAALFFS